MSPVMRLASLILLLLVSILGTACNREETPSSPALVRVDSRVVTLEQFRGEFEATLPVGQDLSDEQRQGLQRSFLIQVIDRELALGEADRLGISVTPEEVETALQEYRRDYPDGAFERMLADRGITLDSWRRELRQSLLMEKVVRRAAYSGVTVSEDEVAGHYREHQEDFDRPEQVRARQIVVAEETEGKRILGLLRQGSSFDEIAREYSLSPDAEQGGDLGFFARGEMPPEFDRTVFELPKGRLSDLVKSEYGYHVFLVEERREAVRLDLDQVRNRIRSRLRSEKEELAYQSWLQDLRSRAAIEVDLSLM